MRTLLAWLLGIAGVVAVGYGTFAPWYADRPATDIPFTDLFAGIQPDSPAPVASLAAPLLVGAALTAIGLLASSAAIRAGAAVLLLTVLAWAVQYGEIGDLQIGFWNTAFGTLLTLVAATLRK